jgi:hypothetical protein
MWRESLFYIFIDKNFKNAKLLDSPISRHRRSMYTVVGVVVSVFGTLIKTLVRLIKVFNERY